MVENAQTPAGPTDQVVNVEVDLATQKVEVSPQQLAVKAGDRVIWKFFHVPVEWTPSIDFDGADPLGPFGSMMQSPGAVWGEVGEIAKDEVLAYRPKLTFGLNDDPTTPASFVYGPVGSLLGRSPSYGFNRTFKIVLETGPDGESLRVDPQIVTIHDGDVVTFDFDLGSVIEAEEIVPQIIFKSFQGDASEQPPNLAFGPFTSLACSTRRIVGMGNNGIKGFYTFSARVVWRTNGVVRWVSSVDPTVDNMGPPPG